MNLKLFNFQPISLSSSSPPPGTEAWVGGWGLDGRRPSEVSSSGRGRGHQHSTLTDDLLSCFKICLKMYQTFEYEVSTLIVVRRLRQEENISGNISSLWNTRRGGATLMTSSIWWILWSEHSEHEEEETFLQSPQFQCIHIEPRSTDEHFTEHFQ